MPQLEGGLGFAKRTAQAFWALAWSPSRNSERDKPKFLSKRPCEVGPHKVRGVRQERQSALAVRNYDSARFVAQQLTSNGMQELSL